MNECAFFTFFILLSFHMPFNYVSSTDKSSGEEIHKGKIDVNASEISTFKHFLTQKRSYQIESVKQMTKYKYEVQYEMINLMFSKIFEVIITSKNVVESSQYIPGSNFPTQDAVKEDLARILENTALFGEIMLRYPKISHMIMAKSENNQWNTLISWSIGFSNSTLLYDKKTIQLMDLLVQEINIVEKSPNYINPYSEEEILKKKLKDIQIDDSKPVKKKKKKRPLKKGPSLSKKMEL